MMTTETATIMALAAIEEPKNDMMNVINKVCSMPDFDINKLEKLLDMQERIMKTQRIQDFSYDLAKMQNELPIVFKAAKSYSATYARLEDINKEILPVLSKFGFSVSFEIEQEGKVVTIKANLQHYKGHSQSTSIKLPLIVPTKQMSEVQIVGATITYGKRYALCALLNISTADDTDGNFNQNDSKLEDALTTIEDSGNLEDLRNLFTKYYAVFTSSIARKKLITAKDNAKRRIQDETI